MPTTHRLSRICTNVPGLLLSALAVTLTCAAVGARADTLFGVYAGAGAWAPNPSGNASSGGSEVDLERDLNLGKKRNNLAYLRLEHGVPILPNLRLNYTDVLTDGRNTLGRSIEFNDRQFLIAEQVSSKIDLTQIDAVAYYEVLDNIVSLDLGLTARWFDGEVEIASESDVARAEFTGVLPLLYARGELKLPFTGLWLGAEMQGIGYSGNRLLDGSAQFGWRSAFGLGAEVGWRMFELRLDDFDDIDSARMEFKGPYLALNYHF
ncbi:MAG: TIGR04219 family outer membrane beta-barrel protein [Pseudomonadales bacterium]